MIYTIKKGQTDWRPRDWFRVFGRFNYLTWMATATLSMQFDYIDTSTGMIDADWNDWKKVGGISLVNWRNPQNLFIKDRDNIQMVWRWNPVLHVHEFAVYMNVKGEKKVFERPDQIIRTIAGTTIAMQVERHTPSSYSASLYLLSQGSGSANAFEIKTRQRFTLYSVIGAWFGGANNSPGEWGGAAPKDMEMEIEIDF